MNTPNTTYRSCGNCTMCCKLLGIKELDKPRNVWCKHCDKGRGCKVYEDKPSSCTEFQCLWTQVHENGSQIPEQFRPDKVRCVITPSNSGEELAIYVDPGMPDAWKTGEFGKYLRTLAARGATLVAIVDPKCYVMKKTKLPHGEEVIAIKEVKATQSADGRVTDIQA